jgi:hypothetical protein
VVLLGLFKKNENRPITTEEMIANKILEQPDRLSTLFSIFEKMPPDLVTYFNYMLNVHNKTKDFAEVYIAQDIALTTDVLPADIVIRKNNDPKLNDIIEICIPDENDYSTMIVKVIKINLKDGTLFVQKQLEPDIKGNVSFKNVICVIKTIKYTDPEWGKIIQMTGIDYDIDELLANAKSNLEYVKNNDFYDKENTLKRLESRINELNKQCKQ